VDEIDVYREETRVLRNRQKKKIEAGIELKKREDLYRMTIVYSAAKRHEGGLSYSDLLNEISEDLGNYTPLAIQLALEAGMIAQSVHNGKTWITVRGKMQSEQEETRGGTLDIIERYVGGGVTRETLEKEKGLNGGEQDVQLHEELNAELRRLLLQNRILIEEGGNPAHDLIVSAKYA
jgi:hypothetical protein